MLLPFFPDTTEKHVFFIWKNYIHIKLPCQEGFESTGGWRTGHDPAVCAHSPEGQPHPGLTAKVVWPAGQGRGFCSSTLLWWEPTWSSASRSGALSTGKTWTCWSRSRGEPQKWSEGWNTSPIRKGRESWGCSAWSREGSREALQ